MGRRAVCRHCSDRGGHQQAALATTAPESGGLKGKEASVSTIKAFIKRHAVPTYYGLAFAISWGGIIIVVGFGGVTGTTKPSDVLLPFVYLAMLAGPSVASLLLTGLVEGKAGFRELVSLLL